MKLGSIDAKNLLVAYKGGGYDGCAWEWNYAYYDAQGNFHCIAATGRNGCKTHEQLVEYITNCDKESFDLYFLDKTRDIKALVDEFCVSHVIGIAKALAKIAPEIVLTVKCSICGKEMDCKDAKGTGIHGTGGAHYEYTDIICDGHPDVE